MAQESFRDMVEGREKKIAARMIKYRFHHRTRDQRPASGRGTSAKGLLENLQSKLGAPRLAK